MSERELAGGLDVAYQRCDKFARQDRWATTMQNTSQDAATTVEAFPKRD